MPTRHRLALAAGASALYIALLPAVAGAHERFVKHSLKQHLKDAFFLQQRGTPFGMDPNMIQIGLLVSLVLAAFFVFFFLREGLDEIIRYKVLASLRGNTQRFVHNLSCFIQDKPVRSKWFYT